MSPSYQNGGSSNQILSGILVPYPNGLLVPYVPQHGPYYQQMYYNLAQGTVHPVPPNKLTLAPMSPSTSLNSPQSSLGSALSSAVSTPTEERQVIMPRVTQEELIRKLKVHDNLTPTVALGQNQPVEKIQKFNQNTAANVVQKVILRPKKTTIVSNEKIQQSVENHFRRSLGSSYDKEVVPETTPRVNVRRRPHSVFVSEEVNI
jgi:hypothetical protein